MHKNMAKINGKTIKFVSCNDSAKRDILPNDRYSARDQEVSSISERRGEHLTACLICLADGVSRASLGRRSRLTLKGSGVLQLSISESTAPGLGVAQEVSKAVVDRGEKERGSCEDMVSVESAR